MANENSNKRCFVEISSSDESKSSSLESDDDAVEISSSTSCTDDVDFDINDDDGCGGDDEEDGGNYYYANTYKDDAEFVGNKVSRLIRGGSDLQELKLNECKAYLRRHKLRLSGTKEECIERIKEHRKLKDGSGEVFYPRSSFTIDCTGDVCKGDIVFFRQKICQISGKTKRSGGFQWRSVAGRIVKESYGAAKQQHTFTVEVLWSRGSKKLDPLFPLLVKGRNLYKMKTFRQPWKNEKTRLEVLSEKHERGATARAIRAMRKSKTDKTLTYKGSNHIRHLSSSRTRETTHAKKNCQYDHETLAKGKKQICSRSSSHSSKQKGGFRGGSSHRAHQNLVQSNQVRESPNSSCYYPSQTFNTFQSDVFPTKLHNLNSHGGFASTSGSPYTHPPPYSERGGFNHGSCIGPAYSHSQNGNEARNFYRFPRSMNNHWSFYSNPDAQRWR